jgi:hypothetical protein
MTSDAILGYDILSITLKRDVDLLGVSLYF